LKKLSLSIATLAGVLAIVRSVPDRSETCSRGNYAHGERMKKTWFKALSLLSLMLAPMAHADWHGGKLTSIQIAYDGSTITFTIAGYVRNNCTCYANWSNTLCLDRSRTSFREEIAMLYSARARGTSVFVNINEASCKVEAMYEVDE
jgi:hypothetical protein